MPRGHSNVYPEETRPYEANPSRARIPLVGGATVTAVKPLPPLSLSREEWQEIGLRMGWYRPREKKSPPTIPNLEST